MSKKESDIEQYLSKASLQRIQKKIESEIENTFEDFDLSSLIREEVIKTLKKPNFLKNALDSCLESVLITDYISDYYDEDKFRELLREIIKENDEIVKDFIKKGLSIFVKNYEIDQNSSVFEQYEEYMFEKLQEKINKSKIKISFSEE